MLINSKTDINYLPTDKQQVAISLIQSELTQCRNEITSYNIQFISSSVMCAILAAIAAAISTSTQNSDYTIIFYLLPTIYFHFLYNIIKYTNEQLQLGAYRIYLSQLLNSYLNQSVLQWESLVKQGPAFIFFGAVVQVFFIVPVAIFMLYQFWCLKHNCLWNVIAFCTIFQVAIILVMVIRLASTQNITLQKLTQPKNNRNQKKFWSAK